MFGGSSPQEAHTDLPTDLIGQTDHIVHVGHVGVSEARNAGLDRLADLGLLDDDHVMSFPDDDCVYPSDLTTALNWTGTSIVCIPYGPSGDRFESRRFPSTSFAVRAVDVPRVVASAGVFLRRISLLRFRFDESLGVGTRSSAGEEFDLVLRLMASGAEAEYRSQPYVVHAYGSPRPERMRGGVAALRFNAKSFPVLYWLIARRLVTALKMTIRARDLGPLNTPYRVPSALVGIPVLRIVTSARAHAVVYGCWTRRELRRGRLAIHMRKALAAICRKIAYACVSTEKSNQIWGDAGRRLAVLCISTTVFG